MSYKNSDQSLYKNNMHIKYLYEKYTIYLDIVVSLTKHHYYKYTILQLLNQVHNQFDIQTESILEYYFRYGL